MEELLGSSSPWIEAGVLLVLGVLAAAAVAALVNLILRRALEDQKTAGRVSGAVFWVLAVVGLLVAVGRLAQPTAVESGLAGAATRLLTALPDLLIAIVVASLGWAVAVVLRSLVRRALTRVRPSLAEVVAPATYWAVLVLTAFVVADQLGVEVGLVGAILVVVVGAVALAAALALGLGTRELVAEVVAGRHVERIVLPGDVIEVAGIQGTVVQRGHASVRVAGPSGELELPNRLLLTNPVRIVSRARDVAVDAEHAEP